MRIRYSEWDEDFIRRLLAERDLMRLFNYLLLQTDGDVDEALRWMRQLQRQGILPGHIDIEAFAKKLRKDRIIKRDGHRHKLTPKGEKQIRQDSLDQIFSSLKTDARGDHPMPHEGGQSAEPLPEHRPFMFGDSAQDIDFNESFTNAMRRAGPGEWSLTEPDLSVRESESSVSCATVLLLDISHSMILYGEDRITPAKQVAMAFAEMILTRYPKDALDVVVFGDDAEEIKVSDLAYVGVGPYHTNTQAGLRLARQILKRRKHHNKQIFMITDGKPSVIRRANGQLYINPVGLDPMIVNRTLDEAVVCRRKKITITTFMVTSDPYLQHFIRKLTELNQGRAYFAPPDRLGGFIFWDFVKNRRRRLR
ncbi:MAG TPA: VWA domain-containing protein [candidate division Zixibacteria bacterium]|nr:VWA domain-containing protein [candidate division Zixibacteria bacterium]